MQADVVARRIAGAGYSVIHLLTRRPGDEPGRAVPPGPGD